ncbi:MAG: HD domain-containing protein [Armatimonadota bacterium]
METHQRLEQQIRFVLELDKLKQIMRQSYLLDTSRKENDAEHSWHLAMMVMVLAEYAATPEIDVLRVVKMTLVHDLVEIDAGDTFIYDEAGALDKQVREEAAADRIFHLLPVDQAAEIRALWEEFEANATQESRFANALDRVEPILLNYYTQGKAWLEHGVTGEMVLTRNQDVVTAGSPLLGEFITDLIHDAVKQGYLLKSEG